MTPSDPPSSERVERLAEDLAALANPRRLRLLHLLTRPAYGAEIADALGVARQSALGHVERLEERGFIRAIPGRRRHGPVKEYEVVPPRIYATAVSLSAMASLEPHGGPQVAAALDTEPLTGWRAGGGAEVEGPRLLVVSGPLKGAHHPLEGGRGRWVIGRDRDCDVRLPHDPFISGRHAEVRADGDGHEVVDAASANGTHVNFSPLPERGRRRLRPGDTLSLGHTCLVYQRD